MLKFKTHSTYICHLTSPLRTFQWSPIACRVNFHAYCKHLLFVHLPPLSDLHNTKRWVSYAHQPGSCLFVFAHMATSDMGGIPWLLLSSSTPQKKQQIASEPAWDSLSWDLTAFYPWEWNDLLSCLYSPLDDKLPKSRSHISLIFILMTSRMCFQHD